MQNAKPFTETIDKNKTYKATVVVHGNRVRQYLNDALLHDVLITSGLDKDDRVVVSGAAFLGDGDLVLVADGPKKAARPAASPSASQRLTLISSGGTR